MAENGLIEGQQPGGERSALADHEQVAHEVRRANGGVSHLDEQRARGRTGIRLGKGHLGVSLDDQQDVVQVVRHASGEPAQGVQDLSLILDPCRRFLQIQGRGNAPRGCLAAGMPPGVAAGLRRILSMVWAIIPLRTRRVPLIAYAFFGAGSPGRRGLSLLQRERT